jgi:hypothetical protein
MLGVIVHAGSPACLNLFLVAFFLVFIETDSIALCYGRIFIFFGLGTLFTPTKAKGLRCGA